MLAHTPKLLPLAVGILAPSAQEPDCWGSPRLPWAYQSRCFKDPKSSVPETLDLGGPGCPQMLPPSQRRQLAPVCCLALPDAIKLYIFLLLD